MRIADYIFLFIVLGIVGGIIYAVKGSSMRESIEQQKQAMRAKGLTLDGSGLAVKTNKIGVSREEEVNRTQASFAKSGKMMAAHSNAFTFGSGAKSQEQLKSEQKANAEAVNKATSRKMASDVMSRNK